MNLGKVTLVPERTKSWSWTLDLFWVSVPFTFACGYWELGGWESLAWFLAVLTNGLLGVIIVMRLLGCTVSIESRERMFISLAKGAAYSVAIIYAWPDDWMGYTYFILLLIVLLLMEIERPKKT